MSNHRGKENSIEGLRGIIAVMIVVYHIYFRDEENRGLALLNQWTINFANALFLMLSGYLISLRNRERIASGELRFFPYMRRRLSGIYPTYLLANIANFAGSVALHGREVISLPRILGSVLMVGGGVIVNQAPYCIPGWFICVIMLAYVLYYPITKLCRRRCIYTAAMVGMVILGALLYRWDMDIPFLRRDPGFGIFSFFLGCVLTELFEVLQRLNTPRELLPTVVMILLTATLIFDAIYGLSVLPVNEMYLYQLWVAPAILYVTLYFTPLRKLLSLPPFTALGYVSMPIFLWQGVIYELVRVLLLVRFNQKAEGIVFWGFFALLLLYSYVYRRALDMLTERWRRRHSDG